MKSFVEAMKTRKSCRTYAEKQVEPQVLVQIREYIASNKECFFGSKVFFSIIDMTSSDAEEIKSLGSYGLLKGVRTVIAGAVTNSDFAMEDYGYLMEKNILLCETLGVKTCWVGGTFDRAAFTLNMKIQKGEVVPAIVPIGYGRDKTRLADTAIRAAIGADARKQWKELFFDEAQKPLLTEAAGIYKDALEMVRLAPSASNKQPWRMMKAGGDTYHLFLERTQGYRKMVKEADMQKLDMGIAMCHFELAAEELGLKGKWERGNNPGGKGEWEYIVSWKSV